MLSADELQKALDLLVHDLRTPLGVAHGYVRLLQDQRLEPDDMARAWAQLRDALNRMARLCDGALQYAHDAEGGALDRVAVAVIVEQLERELAPPVEVAVAQPWSAATVTVARGDGLVDALVRVLEPVRRRHPLLGAAITVDNAELRCRVCREDQGGVFDAEAPRAVDPWKGGEGLALVAAHRAIARAGGRVWTTASAAPGLAVALPLEVV